MMRRTGKVLIFGHGTIGEELVVQLRTRGHEVLGAVTRNTVRWQENDSPRIVHYSPAEAEACVAKFAGQADAIMIAIPNTNKGSDEMKILRRYEDKILVTCAKAASAYHEAEIRKLHLRLGRRASVGGGTDMLEVLRRRHLNDENLIIYAVINGTLNFIMSEVQRGDSFMRALKAAQNNGYAEPNNGDPIESINGELMDVCMKAAITHNVALTQNGELVSPDDFRVVPLGARDIDRLTSRNSRYRYITTFASVADVDEILPECPGSLRATCGRWRISGGFQDVRAESPWYDWLRQVDGVNNGCTIHGSLGEDTGNSISGPGAGAYVTARAMVRDLEDLLAQH